MHFGLTQLGGDPIYSASSPTLSCATYQVGSYDCLLGYIDDHANLLWGLIELFESSFDLDWLAHARNLADRMIELFWDGDAGGLFFTGTDHDNARWASDFPAQDQRGQAAPDIWGSAHPGGFHIVMCDNSVSNVSYSIELDVHQRDTQQRCELVLGVDVVFQVAEQIGDLLWWWRHEHGIAGPTATDPVL